MPYEGPGSNRRVFISTTGWRDIEDEAKDRAAQAIMRGLGMTNFVLFDGPWFYIWLLHTARKNISDERRRELADAANREEVHKPVEVGKS